MDPFGALWAEWLLPLQNWDPSLGADPAWDPAVAEYAQLFQSGAIPSDFSGGCVSQAPRESLRFCADMVIRNYAPDSWLFTPVGGLVSLYFHNTTSFGVCILDERAYDPAPLVRSAERLGLTCEVLGPPAG